LYDGIEHNVLIEFDRLNTDAVQYGLLKVPAWGANTVRSEFAFLSGLEGCALGAHQFNPYEAILRGWRINTLARFLQEQGYRTVCIHPYHASFYRRNSVFPLMGFDEFVDIAQFDGAEHFGPYVSDFSVASKVIDVLGVSDGRPHFIFAITMENHGPLHFEKVSTSEIAALYSTSPPEHWSDLAVYLRHLRNADRMIGTLRQFGEARSEPLSLCWYGDHVPIMEGVYQDLEAPPTNSNYAIWNNFGSASKGAAPQDLKLNELSSIWLRSCELLK
jgi:phosphoglycerol transferase MdoB-like AlkP superfamily enzyme